MPSLIYLVRWVRYFAFFPMLKLNVFIQCNNDELKLPQLECDFVQANAGLAQPPPLRRQLVVRVKFGSIGLVGFFGHLIQDRKVDEEPIEGKARDSWMQLMSAFLSSLVPLNGILISISARLPHCHRLISRQFRTNKANSRLGTQQSSNRKQRSTFAALPHWQTASSK
jgi:hypothetical protein